MGQSQCDVTCSLPPSSPPMQMSSNPKDIQGLYSFKNELQRENERKNVEKNVGEEGENSLPAPGVH